MNQTVSIFSRAGVKLVGDAAVVGATGRPPHISRAGGRFALVDAGGNKYPWPTFNLPVIVVGANPHKSKMYFDGPYDPENSSPPTCWSDNGIGPSVHANKKMARSCAECELGAWGSATSAMTGKGIKACGDYKKIALIVIGDTAEQVYEMQIPAKSLSRWDTYVKLISSYTCPDGSRKADLCDLVTTVSFEPDEPFVLKFEPSAWLDQVDGTVKGGRIGEGADDGGAAIAARLDAIWASTVVDDLVGLNDQPWTGLASPQVTIPPARTTSPELTALENKLQGARKIEAQVAEYESKLQTAAGFAGPPDATPAKPVQLAAPKQRGGARPGAGRPKQDAAMPPIPPFLQRGRTPEAASTPEVQHGMVEAAKPPAGVQDAINKALGLSTGE